MMIMMVRSMALDPEVVGMLTSMGYSEEQTTAALMATDYNIERYLLHLFFLFFSVPFVIIYVRYIQS